MDPSLTGLTTSADELELVSLDHVALSTCVGERIAVVAATDALTPVDDDSLAVTCAACSEWT